MSIFNKVKLFTSENKNNMINIIAPISGQIIHIEDVPDVVFSEKIVGDGIAVNPSGDKIVAPINGTISKIFETNHAFSMKSKSGIELFVHFGIDTINLKGEGFSRIAKEGKKVKIGDLILKIDLLLLQKKAKSVLTPIIISNMDEIKELKKSSGPIIAGETIIMKIIK
ncbi:MAG: PTS glucose transporter subunit IIA [Arsenophonus sp.]|nr:MAG: PTS glucose transporter subunit IIA [Arsenophonus sp.]